jgi:hypothetical protein
MNNEPCKPIEITGQDKAENRRIKMSMLSYFQANDLKTIRSKLIALYALNVSDALLTYALVRTGCFKEANFFMRQFVFNFDQLFFIKVILPFALIAWLYFRIEHATRQQLRLGTAAVNIIVLFYMLVDAFHVIWTVSLIF